MTEANRTIFVHTFRVAAPPEMSIGARKCALSFFFPPQFGFLSGPLQALPSVPCEVKRLAESSNIVNMLTVANKEKKWSFQVANNPSM